ncbi:ATPase, P-type (Transporting), HAD superfamily,subfamily IC [Candidatus Competibacter denitrificans Run_A_D11]|uniref:ATPase, P-type (Transporting), HAD superfamily,subfamily IC n=1 Tax=Candidatus Competibacter denitrificans Run_A_D11 TaxID=1400863 RepID=W6MB38_9GAMM|nr:ATPase, P-type (Transporting), HAD superfamily,subfamily IC [Candidatus Competibacter denitrificans Run_A_D11]
MTISPSPQPPLWHSLDTAQVLQALDTAPGGLSGAEAAHRLAAHGPNRLHPPAQRGPLLRFLLQFHNVIIYVLLASAAITAALGHWVDTGVILGVVFINALVGFVQEGKAESALAAIRKMLSLRALVLRDGQRREITAEELVPGDWVLLQSGDKVPADLRLIDSKNLRIQEAVLTGEAEAVEKATAPVAADAAIGDRANMAYSGTLVSYGQSTGIVIATGEHTEIGRISTLLEQVEEVTTPLLRQTAQFGRWLSLAIVLVAVATFLIGVFWRGLPADNMLMAAVALAVAAIPEGLPAILTVILAIGVQRMAGRHAIVRRLPAVETLGAVTVICSDKTGTLTRNEMTVQRVITADRVIKVSGAGCAPSGDFSVAGASLPPDAAADVQAIARAALLCNDAVLRHADGAWCLAGDPTEGALLAFAGKAGFDQATEAVRWRRLDSIPFESEHRFMATLQHDPQGGHCIFVKGAPERVLAMCASEWRATGTQALEPAYWRQHIEGLAAQGQRVLAVASRPAAETQTELRVDDVAVGLTLLGLLGISDPPREEAIRAVRQTQEAGVRVKMITGDHGVTARAIAAQIGIGDGVKVLTGPELEALDDATLQTVVWDTDVYARASPEHKLRLVAALQANRHVVAMTGDGVNDAPALKRADIGVAMGMNGTEAAKEAADLVLADDNFSSITHAVEEGRTVYDNLRKALLFLLPTNGAQAAIIVIAILFSLPLPITPVQILWVNMVTAVTLALALAFEPTEANVMRRPPRDAAEPLIPGWLVWRIGLATGLLVVAPLALFLWEIGHDRPLAEARTLAVNALVVGEIFYLLNSRRIDASVLSWDGLLGSRAVLVSIGLILLLQLLFTYAPPVQTLMGTAAISAADWLIVTLAGTVLLLWVEAEKTRRRRWGQRA